MARALIVGSDNALSPISRRLEVGRMQRRLAHCFGIAALPLGETGLGMPYLRPNKRAVVTIFGEGG
jgi:hypothetical protein